MGVIDLDPGSAEYGRLVGQTDFLRGDNELHHFGWNALSLSRLACAMRWASIRCYCRNSALMLVAARLRHVASTRWGSKRYPQMNRLAEIVAIA
jgi:methanethiol oxidase